MPLGTPRILNVPLRLVSDFHDDAVHLRPAWVEYDSRHSTHREYLVRFVNDAFAW